MRTATTRCSPSASGACHDRGANALLAVCDIMEAFVSEPHRLFRNIAVIGAGLMGHGIAQVFAAAGFPVAVHDAQPAALAALHGRIRGNLRALGLDEAIAERVRACADLAEAVRDADFVVEAVQEDLAVKQDIFAASRPRRRKMRCWPATPR